MLFWGLVLIFFIIPILLWRRTKPAIIIYLVPISIMLIFLSISIAGLEFPGGLILLAVISVCSAFLAGLLFAFIWREMVGIKE